MRHPLAIIVGFFKSNRYSFNALVGALETEPALDTVPILFVNHPRELRTACHRLVATHAQVAVCFSLGTAQVASMQPIIHQLVAEKHPGLIMVAGGPHPTADPESVIELGFDIAVQGEGEITFVNLLKSINQGHSWHNLPGLAWRDASGRIRLNPAGELVNLDEFFPFATRHQKFGPIEITRGCPFGCGYCQTSHLFGRQPRHRSPAQIFRAAETLRAHGIYGVRIISPDAFGYASPDGKRTNSPAIRHLLSQLRHIMGPKGAIFFGNFPGEVRPEHVTAELLAIVKEFANNKNILIGAQSGSQAVLDRCHRGHTVTDVMAATELTIRQGFIANVDFIFGLPEETPEETSQTLKILQEIVAMGGKIHAHTFVPLPQTGFARHKTGVVPESIRRYLHTILPTGIVYGEWQHQEQQRY